MNLQARLRAARHRMRMAATRSNAEYRAASSEVARIEAQIEAERHPALRGHR